MSRLQAVLAALLLSGAALAATPPSGLAPEIARPDLGGTPVRLHDYLGKVVLVNFWATWCGPCLEEIPAFVTWQREFGTAKLQIVGVSMDDEPQTVRRFMKKTPLDYPVVMGDVALARSWGGVLGLPATYLIDTQGLIVAHVVGETDLKKLKGQISELLPR